MMEARIYVYRYRCRGIDYSYATRTVLCCTHPGTMYSNAGRTVIVVVIVIVIGHAHSERASSQYLQNDLPVTSKYDAVVQYRVVQS